MKILDVFTSKEPGSLDTVEWILRVTVVTLALIMCAVIFTLMFGLFVQDVDNTEIFSIIGPAFNTIVGAFVGLLGGLSLNNVGGKEKPLELTEVAPEPEPDPVVSQPVAASPVVSYETASVIDNEDDDDDDMAPWEKYRHDLRWDVNGDGVVDQDDFPDWRNPEA
jgi:hypothetical protein